jgi:hypothetical protein
MLNFKGMRFPIDVILVRIRWYAAYPLSYRHLEDIMEERGVSVDQSSINRWAIRLAGVNRINGSLIDAALVHRDLVGIAVRDQGLVEEASLQPCRAWQLAGNPQSYPAWRRRGKGIFRRP